MNFSSFDCWRLDVYRKFLEETSDIMLIQTFDFVHYHYMAAEPISFLPFKVPRL